MNALVGEFLGTFIMVLLGNGVVAGNILHKTKEEGTGWIAIVLGWGIAVSIAVYISGFICPAHLNPVVTIGLAAAGMFPWADVPGFVLAQTLGAMVAALMVWLHYYPYWKETKDQGTILGCFSTAPAIRHTPSNILGEALGSAILVILVMALGVNKLSDGMGPIIVGMVVMAIGFSLGPTTGYAINPARDLGPRIMHAILPIENKGDSDWGYAWIPIVGDILGGVVGAVLYHAVMSLV